MTRVRLSDRESEAAHERRKEMAKQDSWLLISEGKERHLSEAQIRAGLAAGTIKAGATVSMEGIGAAPVETVFPGVPSQSSLEDRIQRSVEKCTKQEETAFRVHLEAYLKRLSWFFSIVGVIVSILLGGSIYNSTHSVKSTEKYAKQEIASIASQIIYGVNEEVNQNTANLIENSFLEMSTATTTMQDSLIVEGSKAISDAHQQQKAAVLRQFSEETKSELRRQLIAAYEESYKAFAEDPNMLKRLAEKWQLPPGMIMPFAGAMEDRPDGWLSCDGVIIPQGEEYEALRDLIGENTPDLRGMFLRGAGQHNESKYRYTGDQNRLVGSAQPYATAPPRNNFVANLEHRHDYARAVSGRVRAGGTEEPRNTEGRATTNDALSEGQNTSEGGGDEETRPNNYAVNFIIKAF